MCCLFGLIDTKRVLSGQQKSWLLHGLAAAAEARGTDASGVAFCVNGRIVIRKAPVPGHKLKISIPAEAVTVMGHARQSTQGSARKNKNNHPFCGQAGKDSFALAHNGVLFNDRELRRRLGLPRTRIETDSYVAVQLIEKQKALSLSTLKCMAEKVEGSFTFTVLDERESLYIVKGDSPFCLYADQKAGLYVYASTSEILRSALMDAGIALRATVRVNSGEILRIGRDGRLARRTFDDSGLCQCGFHAAYSTLQRGTSRRSRTYVDELKSVSCAYGYTPEMIDRMIDRGFTPEEIEAYLYEI